MSDRKQQTLRLTEEEEKIVNDIKKKTGIRTTNKLFIYLLNIYYEAENTRKTSFAIEKDLKEKLRSSNEELNRLKSLLKMKQRLENELSELNKSLDSI